MCAHIPSFCVFKIMPQRYYTCGLIAVLKHCQSLVFAGFHTLAFALAFVVNAT